MIVLTFALLSAGCEAGGRINAPAPLPTPILDAAFNPKPAYEAFKEALAGK